MRPVALLLLLAAAPFTPAHAAPPSVAVAPELVLAPPVSVEPLAAARALASFGDDQRQKAMLLLSGYHGIGTRQEFEAALAEPSAILGAIARDPASDPVHRDRALAALAYWPDEQTLSLYASLLASPDTSEMNRHRLIGYLAKGYGERAIPWVEHYLTVPDLQFRLTAIEALSGMKSDHARDLLLQAEVVEVSPVALERIKAARATLRALP